MKRTFLFSAFLLCGVAFAQDPIVSAQTRISPDPLSTAGNETSAASSSNGQDIIGGFNDWRTDGTIKTSFGVSSNGGSTWAQLIVRPPVANQTTVEGDPMACYDPRTNTMWAGSIAFGGNGGIYVAKKTIGQNTFGPSVMARISGSADKGWMACGPIPGNPNSTRLYIAFNQGVVWSNDLGSTFNNPVSLGGGLGFLPRVGPAGELYITYWDTGAGVRLKRSLDGGNSFTTHNVATRMDVWGTEAPNGRVPGTYRIPPIHTMAVNPVNGTIVVIYFDTTNTVSGNRNIDLYMAKSTNQGTTWTVPQRLPFRQMNAIGDMFFPWAEYTADGRLHLTAFNSGYTVQNDGISHGLLDADYAYSDDDGANFTRFRLTPSPFDSFNTLHGNSFMGDYLGIGINNRTVFPVYPDLRTGQLEIYTNKVYNPIVRPSAFTFSRGTQTGGNLASLFLRDSSILSGKPDAFHSVSQPPIQLELTCNVPSQTPSSLKLHLWSAVSVTNIQQQVLMLNVGTQQWDVVDTRSAPTSETNMVITVATPASYIGANGLVKTRVSYRPVGLLANNSWTVDTNQAVLLAGP